ncbi:MAG: TRAP transporter large permease [Deltaproteobacteria bacterium]|nr:TRAP transporter large permease [Deltaproteobacteria bacterium]
MGFGVLLFAFALLGAPLFLVISGTALASFMSVGRPAADVTGEISKLVQMDTLITIPLFTFAGYLLAESGAPRRLVAVSRAVFGCIPGGMALVTLITCAFFTTFTGASGITIVALGGLLLPVLLKEGYGRNFSLGLVTTSGSRGLVFPPSLPVIIYGYVAAVDITRLYVAGIIPGLIDLGVIAVIAVYFGVKSGVPRTPFEPKEAWRALLVALPEVLLPVWLIVFILTGTLKVPEAAAMAALYVLLIEIFVYRDVHPIRDLPRITKESMVLCGAILVIVGAALGLTNFLVDRQIPQAIVGFISSTIESKWLFLLALNLFLLVVGCLLDIFSAIVIVVPLIVPLAAKFGIHPMHLAIIFLINLELGYNTPPVGMNLFIASFRFRQPIVRLYRAAVPFVLANLIALLVITYFPVVTTFTVPQGQATIKGGMVEQPTPGATPQKGAAPPAKKRPPILDGICEGDPKDPDCQGDDIDDELDDLDDDKKKPAPAPPTTQKATP